MNRRDFLKTAVGAGTQLVTWRSTVANAADDERPFRLAFGACARQERPQPIWDAIAGRQPDLFAFLGDNVYGDTRDINVLRDQYKALAAKPEFARFRSRVPLVATWDDHDYGENNADSRYPMKRESKQVFLDFFDEPKDTERRLRDGGIYTAYSFGPPGRIVQLILLDTRYHRSPFSMVDVPTALLRKLSGRGPYRPQQSSRRTMLGPAQWAWLERQFSAPADVRIVATSTPFVSSFTGSETWANLPNERRRMVELIRRTGAGGVLFISGDIHRAELSAARDATLPYTLWELTSSGLNRSNLYESFNKNRQGEPYRGHNFGLIEVDWRASEPAVTLQACSRDGEAMIAQRMPIAELQPAAL